MKVKKIGSLLLALVMCFSLMSVAWADDENTHEPDEQFTITVTNKNATSTNYDEYVYAAYQIFSGTLTDTKDDVTGNVVGTTLSNIEWGEAFEEYADYLLEKLAEIEIGGAYPFAGCTSAEEVADVLSGNANDSDIALAFAETVALFVETYEIEAAGESTESWDATAGASYTIDGLYAGYYIVLNTAVPEEDSGAWTAPILYVVEDVKVEAKSDVPEVTKEIVDNDRTDTTENGGIDENYSGNMTYTDNTENEAIGQVGDYTIGTDIWFQITGTLPSDYDSYDDYVMIFHDTESEGLTFNSDSVTVYVDINGDGNLTQVESGYEVVATELEDNCTFEVQITNTKALIGMDGQVISTNSNSVIVVQYQSTLNSDAVIGGTGNPNEVYMEFSNKSYDEGTGKTQPVKVWAFTFELDVHKYTTGDTDKQLLEGAKFVLQNKNEEYLAVYTYVDGVKTLVTNTTEITTDQTYTAEWITLTPDEEGNYDYSKVTVLVTDSEKKITIPGIDEGTYTLTEIEAPNGYNMLEDSLEVKIEATYAVDESSGDVYISNLTVTVNEDAAVPGETDDEKKYTGVVTVEVGNAHGSHLPSTGGIGTAIFYIIGGVLVVGAAVVLIARRRMSREAE